MRILGIGLLFFVACGWSGFAQAETLTTASTSRTDRNDAIRSIPFDKLTPETRQLLADVVQKPTIYRRMPTESIACDPDMFLFLVRNPEVVVNIWELMGISNVKFERTGEFTFKTTDNSGTVSDVQLVYGTSDTHIIYAQGYYEGSMFRNKVYGRGVLVLRTAYERTQADSYKLINRLDLFLQIDNVGADLLARTFQPLVGRSADYNFQETNSFVSRISEAAVENGPSVEQLSDKLEGVRPEVRQRFSEVARVVHHKAILRNTNVARGQVPGAPPP